MDLNKIKNELTNKYDLSKTKKSYADFNELLRMDIKKTLLDIPFIKQNREKPELNNKNINKEEDIELTEEEIENNFYVQATKESFDDLLFGAEDNDFDEIQQLINIEEENVKEKKNDLFGVNSNNKRKREGKDDFENYLIRSGYYKN